MMQAKLISCQVMIDEIMPFLPETVATEVFEISLHTHPELLRTALQQAIDGSDGVYDPIYLGYGLCGKATVGLLAKKSRLVVPKNDDCIAIFLGSTEARREQLESEPGTYYLTQGWIGGGAGSLFADYDRMVEKYGAVRAERFVGKMLRNYKRLAYIRLPNTTNLETDREYARAQAERFHMDYTEMDGTPQILQRMIKHDWDEDFVVAEPGQPISIEQFLGGKKNGRG